MKKILQVLLLSFSMILLVSSPCLSAKKISSPSKKEHEITISSILKILGGMKFYKHIDPDVLYTIVESLEAVKEGKLKADDFFKKTSALKMPQGQDLRYVLMTIKSDIGKHLGSDGLEKILGEQYPEPEGGSHVERILLEHRRKIVNGAIHDAIKHVAATNPRFSAFYSEVGSWPDESLRQMKFAGDIDFNFLCGDMATALALKKAFDDSIVRQYGRTPEDLDIPCTVHGSATGEVYVGHHGQKFVEGEMKNRTVKKISFGDNKTPVGVMHDSEINFQEARDIMLLEAELSKTPLPDVEDLKVKTQPGLTLEMIRHFEHDIVKQNAYSELESFIKAAKYLDRHYKSLVEEAGEGAVKDKTLRDFAKNLVENKNSPRVQVELIEKYFDAIHQPIPFKADLKLNKTGKSGATIQANQKVIDTFWKQCRNTMWETANNKIEEVTNQLKQKSQKLNKNSHAVEVRALDNEISMFQRMLEVEDHILRHEKVGISDHLVPQYTKNIEAFRKSVKQARQKMAKNGLLKSINPTIQGVYNLSEGLSESKNDMSTQMAAAAWLTATLDAGTGRINNTLDFIDDGLMDRLRHGPAKGYDTLLKNGQELYWSSQVDQFLEGTGITLSTNSAEALNNYQKNAQKRVKRTSDWMTNKLKKSVVGRGAKWLGKSGQTAIGITQTVNNSFNESVSASHAGQAMMKGMMVYNLSQELPVYWDAMLNNDWNKLATELFKRRVPFGSAVESYMMGSYWGAFWEVCTTIVPPAALLSVTKSLATELALTSIDISWSAELDKFIDDLYNDAEFKIIRVETTGENLKISGWQLLTVTVDGKKHNYDEAIQLSVNASKEMAKCMKVPSQKRNSCWPFEKENPLFKGWEREFAFKESFAKTDPWIQLIEEMGKNKIVGPKMKDYYFYQKQQRYEELKVDFLLHTSEKLEQRRAGEQVLLSGGLPKIYEELLRIANKLQIDAQVEQNINEQFGGEFSQGLTYGKDLIIGSIFRGDDDIWDVYRERASVITEALKTYKHIWEGRKEAEQLLVLNNRDQGLRILTGPFFLSGRATEDQAAAEKWVQTPARVKLQMLETLIDIKVDAETDPVALDLSEGSYDYNTLEQLIYHETFKEMWKHVFNQPAAQKIASSVRPDNSAGEEPGETEQDHALQRFKLHESRVEKILNDFRAHYNLEEGGLLSELRQKLDQANLLTTGVCTASNTATTNLDKISPAIESVQKSFYSYEKSIQDTVNIARDLESIEKLLTEKHQLAEKLAIAIGDETTLAGEKRQTVCSAAEELKTCDSNSKRDRLVAEATSAHSEIKPAFESARASSLELKGLDGEIKATLDKLTKAQQQAGTVNELPTELIEAKTNIDKNLLSAETLLKTIAEEKLPAISEVVVSAKDLASSLKGDPTLSEETGVLQEIDSVIGQILSLQTKSEGCLDPPQTRLLTEKSTAEDFLNRYSKLEINLNRIKKVFGDDSEGNPNPLFTSALEKANLADLLISMGEGYIRTCAEHMLLAKVCMNVVDQLKKIDYSFTMPNIVGLDCQEGANTVAGNSIQYQIVSTGKAPHPDWEYCVDATDPPAGEEVSKKNGSVLISCFEELDIPAYLATVDCSWLPGGTAVYNSAQRIGVCDCINGSVFNTSKDRCINCNDYFQAMVGAFNAGDLDTAQAWVNESQFCPWVADAQSQINAERHRLLCIKLNNNIFSACQSGNARAANGALGDAYGQNCQVDPQLQQWVTALIDEHNQHVSQQQAQRQAQNRRNMQNFINLIAQGLNSAASNKPTPTPPPPSRNGSSSSSGSGPGSSSGGGTDPCGGCPPGNICILGVCNKSSGVSQ